MYIRFYCVDIWRLSWDNTTTPDMHIDGVQGRI